MSYQVFEKKKNHWTNIIRTEKVKTGLSPKIILPPIPDPAIFSVDFVPLVQPTLTLQPLLNSYKNMTTSLVSSKFLKALQDKGANENERRAPQARLSHQPMAKHRLN